MTREVIDADHRHARPSRQPFGKHHARKHATDQPRTRRHSDRVEIAQGNLRLRQRAFRHHIDAFRVRSRRDLWHDATEGAVQILLAEDNRGLDPRSQRPVPHHSGCGFIACALKPKNDHTGSGCPPTLREFSECC